MNNSSWGQDNTPGNAPIEEPPAPPQQQMTVARELVKPTVTYTILVITVLVYVLQEAVSNGIFRAPFLALSNQVLGADVMQQLTANGSAGDLLTLLGGKITYFILIGQYWRLITPVLLHASIAHIGFNMYALYAIGSQLESNYGHGRYLALYLLAGLGGNVASMLMTPAISVGASTAIFGLIAAEGVFIYQNRALFGSRARGMLTNIAVIVVINLVLGLSPGIDNWGHLGGMIAGLIFGWEAGPLLAVEGSWPHLKLVDRRGMTQATIGAVVVLVFCALAIAASYARYASLLA